MSDYLESLNPAQREAVENFEGPALIVAGAGSGKTRVLTCRIARMIERGVPPHSVLALTFTNKAAREMKERIAAIVPGGGSRHIWMGTFHSIFYRILRTEAERLGYTPQFTIYDTGQSETLIKHIVKDLNLNEEEYKAREVYSRISLAKNNLVTAEAYAASGAFTEEDSRRKRPDFARIFTMYAHRCRQNNAMDFDDLLLQTNILLRDNPDVLEKYRQKFRYILVDEYQDTNFAQYLIVRRLAEQNGNICVVGDDAQSIYSFRGAKIENILRFQSDFPQARIFKLERNYRSTRTIVEAANSLIEKNTRRLSKTVYSENGQGDRIRVLRAYTDQEEAQMVADEIRGIGFENGGRWNETSILYRTNAQSHAFEDALRRKGIPYRIYGGRSFYDRKEIRDMVAYFRLIVNPRDDEAFRRIINTPARGIGDVTMEKLSAAAREKGVSLWEAASSLTDAAKGAGRRIVEFVELIASLSLERIQKGLYEFGLEVGIRSGIIGTYKTSATPEAENALSNIEELLNSMQHFREQEYVPVEDEEAEAGEPTLEQWLQNISLLTDSDEEDADDDNRVTLMTVHSAKGLEFDNVFVVGMEDNLFPSLRSMSSVEGLEEERRLFYVALTRARMKAFLSFAQSRYRWGSMEFCKPSRFLGEIEQKYLDVRFTQEDDVPSEDPVEKLRRKLGLSAGNASGSAYRNRPAAVQKPAVEMQPVARYKKNVTDEEDKPTVSQAGGYSVGMTVEHQRFGRGRITEIEQLASDLKITVIFADRNAGQKKLLARYAGLKIIAG